MKTSILLLFFLTGLSVQAQLSTHSLKKEKVVGNIIKNALETYHYSKIKVDDTVSQKAFWEYIDRLDYGKQFFIQSDINKLKKFQFKLDDQMTSGNHKLVELSREIIEKRIKEADKYRKEIFSKSFNFKEKDSLELDGEKRKFVKNSNELRKRWEKVLKQATLTRYLSLKEDQKSEKEGKEKVMEVVKERFRKKDERNLANMIVEGSVH